MKIRVALTCLVVISLSQRVITLTAKNHDLFPLHLNSTVATNTTATTNQTPGGSVSTNTSAVAVPTSGSLTPSQPDSTGGNSTTVNSTSSANSTSVQTS